MESSEKEIPVVELAFEEGEENPLEAPPINLWYHGVLNRTDARHLLKQDGRPGAYLVRERVITQETVGNVGGDQEDAECSEDNSRYALSYLSYEMKPFHFKIRSYYGTYLIGSTSFESLQSLVGYYTNKGYIMSGKRLMYPVAPAGEPVEVKERLVAVLPYNKNPDSDELSFAKGDIFLQEEELSGDWLWVTELHTRASGLVHSKLVRPLNPDVVVKPEDLDYFYGPEVSHDDVKVALCGKPIGAYLLRHSERNPRNYTLYVVCPDNSNSNHTKRFPINAEGNKLYMGKPGCKIDFNTIEEIVDRYRLREISEGCTLSMPILKRRTPRSHGQFGAASGPDEEDIYDSVRRAQRPQMNAVSGGSGSDNVLEGYLFKFIKKWKRMYFVLKRNSSDLLYYEVNKNTPHPPQKIKPKGIIDLNYTDMYPAHYSLHLKENCFQLVVSSSSPHQSPQMHVLYCENDIEAESWRTYLRTLCANTREACDFEQKRQNSRRARDLVVTVKDAHNLATNKSYICIVCLNGVQVARTSPQDGKDPTWDEEFKFLDLPENMAKLSISVYPKSRRRDGDCEVQLERRFADMREEDLQETGSNDDGKKLRVTIRYAELFILPRCRLAPVEYALLQDSTVFAPLAKFGDNLDENQRKTLAQSLLNIFLIYDRQSELILSIGKAVVDAGSRDGLLFRQNTFLSSILICYMQVTALKWMHECLDGVTAEILKLGSDLDTDPTKCPMCSALQQHPVPLHHSYSSSHTHGHSSVLGGASSSLSGCICDQNANKLNDLLTTAVTAICSHRDSFPPILRHVLSQLHDQVISQWYSPDSDPSSVPSDVHSSTHHHQQQHTKKHVVAASFIFLRFLCKALSQPVAMNLIREQPTKASQATMKSLAGLIQNLANCSTPKNKKFEVMQPYLEELQPRITDFIVKLMSPHNGSAPKPSEVEMEYKKGISLSRDCSQVLSVLSKHLDAIRQFRELEKLVSAVEAMEATGTSCSNTPRR